MRLRRLFGLVSAFSIATLILGGSGSRCFAEIVSSSSVDSPIEISTALVATYEISSFASVPLRAPVNVDVGVPGDVSGDSWVDGKDITVISDHWLEMGPPPPVGDANTDDVVNIFDVNFVAANWKPVPIPEPSSVVLLTLAAPGLWWIRRKMGR